MSTSKLGLGVGDLDVCTNKVHGECTTSSTNHEEVSSTHVVNKNHEPDKGQSSLDNTKDTRGEEAGVCSGNADRFEDGRAVVVDGVDSGA